VRPQRLLELLVARMAIVGLDRRHDRFGRPGAG
jgi:hypothetical protein